MIFWYLMVWNYTSVFNMGSQIQKDKSHIISLILHLKVDLLHTENKIPFNKNRNEYITRKKWMKLINKFKITLTWEQKLCSAYHSDYV